MSPEEALAYIMECNMSVDTYNKTREIALKHGHNFFLSYKMILAAKKETYPSIMHVTEMSAVHHSNRYLIKRLLDY